MWDRDTRVRLLAAPLVLALVLGVLALHDATGSAWPSDLLLVAVAFGAGVELGRLLAPGAGPGVAPPGRLAPGFGAAALCAVGLLAPGDPGLRMELRVLFAGAVVLLPLVWRLEDLRPQAAGALARGTQAALLAGLPLSFLLELQGGADGARRLGFVVLVAKASDMGAWAVGRLLGRHRLLPAVSPGKTWEGLAGGVAASVAAALLLPEALGLAPEGAWGAAERVAFGVLLALASALAGLVHSGLKRRAGAKDSGALVPALGGVLDLVDSLLLAAPAAWLWSRLG